MSSKSWLILKDPSKLSGGGTFSEITVQHKLTANDILVLRVEEWCRRHKIMSKIAKCQPHTTYSVDIHGEQHKFTYFTRTLTNTSHQSIDEVFITAPFGCNITKKGREIIVLPIKDGDLGIRSIAVNAENDYDASMKITTHLTETIVTQLDDLSTEDVGSHTYDENKGIEQQKHRCQEAVLQNPSQAGASSWHGALPSQKQGFNLSRGEFQDALRLRCDKQFKNLQSKCACGANFDTTHAIVIVVVTQRHQPFRL